MNEPSHEGPGPFAKRTLRKRANIDAESAIPTPELKLKLYPALY